MSIESEERPRKKKKKKRQQKSSAALIVGIVVGLVVLMVGGVVLYAVLNPRKEEPQAKAPPPPPTKGLTHEPRPKKGKGLITAIARRTEVSEVNNWFRQLGIAYQAASLDNTTGQGPSKFEQLGPNFASSPLKEWYDKEWVKVVWGVRITNVQSRSSTALAWETDADSVGNRVVLMCDGSVQFIHESDFAGMAKAMGR